MNLNKEQKGLNLVILGQRWDILPHCGLVEPCRMGIAKQSYTPYRFIEKSSVRNKECDKLIRRHLSFQQILYFVGRLLFSNGPQLPALIGPN